MFMQRLLMIIIHLIQWNLNACIEHQHGVHYYTYINQKLIIIIEKETKRRYHVQCHVTEKKIYSSLPKGKKGI